MHEGARQKYEEWDPEENGQMVIGKSPSPSFRFSCASADCDRPLCAIDNSASTSEAPPDPFASVEKNLSQKKKVMSEATRLSTMYEQNSNHWEDPYYTSSILRDSFRKKKRKIVASEDKAEKVREKFGLGDRVGVESLRTPARQEDRDEEERAWKAVQKERQARRIEDGKKRAREEDQVGWSIPAKSKGKEKATPATATRRMVAPLPARARSTGSKPSPALKALHDKLSLASAVKNDPFLRSTSSPSSSSTGSALAGSVKLVRKASSSK